MILQVDHSSHVSNKFITPLGRSYDGYHWERLPPFHPDFLGHCDSESSCAVTIPAAKGTEKFFLYRYSHAISPGEDAARFLNQATFGATVDLVNDYMDSSKTPSSFLQDQMDEAISSEHRKLFRAQNFRRLPFNARVGKTRHPCEVGSRWRSYVFVTEEPSSFWESVSFAPVFEETGHGTYVVKIKGHPRSEFSSIPIVRAYQRSNSAKAEVYLNQPMRITPTEGIPTEGPNELVKLARSGSWVYYHPGNPPVEFIRPDLIDGITILSLSEVEEQSFEIVNNEATNGAQIVLTSNDLSDEQCASFPTFYNQQETILIVVNGTWYMNDPGVVLEENTVDNPLVDGGGEIALLDPHNLACSNAPRTFLNEKGCTLSRSLSACALDEIIYDSDGDNPLLNEETLSNLFELTNRERYVYIVDNLRVDPSFGSLRNPCSSGVTTRWLKIDKGNDPCEEVGFPNEATKTELISLLLGARGDNEILIDIVGTGCTVDSVLYGITIEIESGVCYQHVHGDLLNVYDMTYWTQPDTHLGNRGEVPNPITRFAEPTEEGVEPTFTLQYGHPSIMDRWENEHSHFTYIGRAGDRIKYDDLPEHLRIPSVAHYFGTLGSPNSGVDTVVCGSPGEVGRDFTADDLASLPLRDKDDTTINPRQKGGIWNTIVLRRPDQLRQRVAWALSQILVVSPGAINYAEQSEAFLKYYDIFVRNAFGNYFDILKEVAYSPMMGEMLSFLNSRSRQDLYSSNSLLVFPDENFAREIMQLFTIGLVKLNSDGTVVRDQESGAKIENYDNDDIMTGARLWTGFERHDSRSNTEAATFWGNRIDPMKMVSRSRDRYPKMNLYDGYVGDGYPLCHDLPSKPFLKKGAKFRVLGEKSRPELQFEDSTFVLNDDVTRLTLDPNSRLYQALCVAVDSVCTFPAVVTLDTNLDCYGVECEIEMASVLKMGGLGDRKIHYEYVRQPCVDLAFMDDGKMVQHRHGFYVCGHPKKAIAVPSCCSNDGGVLIDSETPTYCNYVGEKMSFEEAEKRCVANNGFHCSDSTMAAFSSSEGNNCAIDRWWYWSSSSCVSKVKIDLITREVIVVHDAPGITTRDPVDYLRPDKTVTFFRVNWEDKESLPSTCESPCTEVAFDGSCMCPISIVTSTVFDGRPTDLSEISSTKLHIGSADPRSFDDGVFNNHIVWDDGEMRSVFVWVPSDGTVDDMRTVFEFREKGVTKFYRNMISVVEVQIGTETYRFRNAPHFNSMQDYNNRDAMDETDAYLTHLVYHDNTAPFIAIRLMQRFGFSNPSSRFVSVVVKAFTDGKYRSSDGVDFGVGKYGDLAATISSILLDRESRSVSLDSDPISGSLKEPLMRVLQFMRAMEFELNPQIPRLQLDTFSSIGEEAHKLPSVFSFFLPEYSPPGKLSLAQLLSPEALLLNTPKALGLVGGLFSLVKYGMSECETDWVPRNHNDYLCGRYPEGDYVDSVGRLKFTPGNLLDHRSSSTTTQEDLVDELGLLLAPGRLSLQNREILLGALDFAKSETSNTATHLRAVQQLMAALPEFHTTNLLQLTGVPRPEPPPVEAPTKDHKAIVFFFLAGGADTYNLLVPHSGCPARDLYEHYRSVRGSIALSKNDLLTIDAKDSNQVCETFGIHPKAPFFKQLYDDGDLSFVANAGVLFKPSNKYNYRENHPTSLFAHNIMTEETCVIDGYQEFAGTGVLGRAATRLQNLADPYLVKSMSLAGQAISLVGEPGISPPVSHMTGSGVDEFDPRPSFTNMTDYIKALNGEVEVTSSLYGETWSSTFFNALFENSETKDILDASKLSSDWNTDTYSENNLEIIARMIKAAHARGSERDVFFVQLGGWDSHADIEISLNDRLNAVNEAIEGFVGEMKAQNKFDDVLMVLGSEFGRTMTPNSGAGSDHGWGGNYALIGGDVKGGKIHGTFPDDLSDVSPLGVGRGRQIPTTSWDHIWNGVFQWFGLTENEDLDYALPNRNAFNDLFTRNDLFN